MSYTTFHRFPINSVVRIIPGPAEQRPFEWNDIVPEQFAVVTGYRKNVLGEIVVVLKEIVSDHEDIPELKELVLHPGNKMKLMIPISELIVSPPTESI